VDVLRPIASITERGAKLDEMSRSAHGSARIPDADIWLPVSQDRCSIKRQNGAAIFDAAIWLASAQLTWLRVRHPAYIGSSWTGVCGTAACTSRYESSIGASGGPQDFGTRGEHGGGAAAQLAFVAR